MQNIGEETWVTWTCEKFTLYSVHCIYVMMWKQLKWIEVPKFASRVAAEVIVKFESRFILRISLQGATGFFWVGAQGTFGDSKSNLKVKSAMRLHGRFLKTILGIWRRGTVHAPMPLLSLGCALTPPYSIEAWCLLLSIHSRIFAAMGKSTAYESGLQIALPVFVDEVHGDSVNYCKVQHKYEMSTHSILQFSNSKSPGCKKPSAPAAQ